MSQLKHLEQLIDNVDSIIAIKNALIEIHQVLCWFYEWLQNIEEKISKEANNDGLTK